MCNFSKSSGKSYFATILWIPASRWNDGRLDEIGIPAGGGNPELLPELIDNLQLCDIIYYD